MSLARPNAEPPGRRDRGEICGLSRRLGVAALKVVALSAIVLTAGCNAREEQSRFRPTATIKDIMTSVIDPEADVLWNSVATIVTASGTEERAPRTDEDWAALRRSAIQLVEATNLLRVPGRLVARPGEKSENPRIELQPETIQKMIAEDPAGWSALVDRLHDAAAPALKAIDARDVKGLFDAGDQIEHACEACHQRYWYPPAAASAWKHEPGGRSEVAPPPAPVTTTKGGTIKGHVAVKGAVPGNPIIRMGMDPMCAKLNAGRRPVQEIVLAGADGSLANVFVSLQGTFPASPVPAEPVKIDQHACVYVPRVVGARVGQTLQVRNSDEVLHNVHSASAHGNDFNLSQPTAGTGHRLSLRNAETMLRITCDVHRWMTAFVGVVEHPYFATSGTDGSFTIANVPPGTHTIQAWHEHYGEVTETVRVTEGATSTVQFTYEK